MLMVAIFRWIAVGYRLDNGQGDLTWWIPGTFCQFIIRPLKPRTIQSTHLLPGQCAPEDPKWTTGMLKCESTNILNREQPHPPSLPICILIASTRNKTQKVETYEPYCNCNNRRCDSFEARHQIKQNNGSHIHGVWNNVDNVFPTLAFAEWNWNLMNPLCKE